MILDYFFPVEYFTDSVYSDDEVDVNWEFDADLMQFVNEGLKNNERIKLAKELYNKLDNNQKEFLAEPDSWEISNANSIEKLSKQNFEYFMEELCSDFEDYILEEFEDRIYAFYYDQAEEEYKNSKNRDSDY